MDSMDGTNGMDNMDTIEFSEPGDPGGPASSGAPDPARGSGRAKWSGKTKRIVTSVAASTVLLGSGAAIGVALTGGASASTAGTSPGTAASSSAATPAGSAAAGRCAKLVERLTANDHKVAASRLRAFCKSPLVRLALVGGAHGEVTFQTKAGPKTIAVERGTIQSVSDAGITVLAKDGTTWAWDFVASTVVRDDKQAVGRNQLSNGETVLVLGQVVGGVHDARLIRVHA
jgi:hypothetical protein